ncbi:hypothetical protein Taro_012416 [Colocasia esculenta]|uniref:DUF985 domain-containing protein n=1 Tax=Colocasia esculenta TaxID=4460 RepID=A0A843UJ35_COLES|nr:hypothetical protein [Colocasia esculenta]
MGLSIQGDQELRRGFGVMVKNSKNEEEAPRTPSPHEILSSLASSPRPTTFGNELGLAKRVSDCKIAAMLDLKAHPEGGFYKETFRDSSIVLPNSRLPPQYKVDRPVSTAIYFMLPTGNLESGQLLQYTVPPNTWFGSFPTKDVETYATDGSSLVLAPSRDPDRHYSLVGCTCAPAFPFEDFEMAKYDEIAPLAPKG